MKNQGKNTVHLAIQLAVQLAVKQGTQLVSATLLLTTTFLAVTTRPAHACSCMAPEAASVERDRATAVFTGTVTDIAPVASGDGPNLFPPQNRYTVTFEVSEQWKGGLGDTATVSTATQSAACGYNFEAGEAYLVYTYGEATNLQTGLCSRTSRLENAAEDIVELGNAIPAAPTEATTGTKPDCNHPGFFRQLLLRRPLLRKSNQGVTGSISKLLGK